MSYQIKEVSELLGISIYTLRYYERIGLLNNVKRDQYGRREFSEDDILTLNTVECLKQTGMSLQNIKRYVQLVGEGIDTAPERLQLFERQQAKVEAQMQDLQEKLDLINGKVKYTKRRSKRDDLMFVMMKSQLLFKNFSKKNRCHRVSSSSYNQSEVII